MGLYRVTGVHFKGRILWQVTYLGKAVIKKQTPKWSSPIVERSSREKSKK